MLLYDRNDGPIKKGVLEFRNELDRAFIKQLIKPVLIYSQESRILVINNAWLNNWRKTNVVYLGFFKSEIEQIDLNLISIYNMN